jgi:hypothetical protein
MALHVIHFYGFINPSTVPNLRDVILSAIQQGNASEILLMLSSEGGESHSRIYRLSILAPNVPNTHYTHLQHKHRGIYRRTGVFSL